MAAKNSMFPFGNIPLVEADPEVAELVEKEKNRQWRGLELIASEVGIPARVLLTRPKLLF
jgi:glycine/serine hydroxymethyltransferase